MKGPAFLIPSLYKYPKMFDGKILENALIKTLQAFFKSNVINGFAAFSSVDRILFEAVLDNLKAKDLREALQGYNEGALPPKATEKVMRARVLNLVYGDPEPVDKTEAARKTLAKLKSAKKIDDLRLFHSEIKDEKLLITALQLMNDTALASFARRFDKDNFALAGADKDTIVNHLNDLAAARVDPHPKLIKKLRTAASKAKWSGKEPE